VGNTAVQFAFLHKERPWFMRMGKPRNTAQNPSSIIPRAFNQEGNLWQMFAHFTMVQVAWTSIGDPVLVFATMPCSAFPLLVNEACSAPRPQVSVQFQKTNVSETLWSNIGNRNGYICRSLLIQKSEEPHGFCEADPLSFDAYSRKVLTPVSASL